MKKRNLIKLAGYAVGQAKKDEKFHHLIFAFFRMIKAYLSRQYAINLFNIFVGIVILLYLLSPLDFIPEIAFGPFGLIDDLTIFILSMRLLNKEVVKYILWEKEMSMR